MRAFPLLLLTWLLVFAGAACAQGNWAGTWDTNWRGSGGQTVIEQDGDNVSGRYPLYELSIKGKVDADGSKLTGNWDGGNRSGTFVAVLSRDKNTFTGRFDTGEWWTGERTSHPDVALRIGLRSPRQAVVSFVVSGNLARSGMDDAWAAAADAVEFDASAGVAMSRTGQLDAVRSLFALVDFTTFRYWNIPDAPPGANSVTLRLEQGGSDAALSLTLHQDAAGDWRIVLPAPAELRAARAALLAVHGGKRPASDAHLRLQNPRDAMRTFLEGMADWEGPGRALALSTLNLRSFPEILRESTGEISAQYLRRVLNHIGLVGLQSIPNDGTSREPYVHFVHGVGRIIIGPSGAAPDAPWQFTPETIAAVRDLYVATERLPPPLAAPPGLIPHSDYFALREIVARTAPALLTRLRQMEIWQALAGLSTLIIALTVGRFACWLLSRGLRRLVPTQVESRWFRWSLAWLIAIALMSPIPVILGLPGGVREHTVPFWGVLACLAAGVVAWHLLHLLGVVLAAMAARTRTQTDDILFTLLLATARLGIIMAVALGLAYFLSIPTTNILAGLGIGGLALAFASRETLSNVFGAGILVTDRPFRRGDWIVAGNIEGAVEEVGIRSTRIRTAQDSVVVVPNGKLVDSTIDNLGTRRYRLVTLKVVVTAGGTPERLDAFVAAVRQRIAGDAAYIANRTDVGVSEVERGGVEVSINSYISVTTGHSENEARHELLLDLVRLAGESGLTLGSGIASSA